MTPVPNCLMIVNNIPEPFILSIFFIIRGAYTAVYLLALHQGHASEYLTKCAGKQHWEDKSNAELYVVISVLPLTSSLCGPSYTMSVGYGLVKAHSRSARTGVLTLHQHGSGSSLQMPLPNAHAHLHVLPCVLLQLLQLQPPLLSRRGRRRTLIDALALIRPGGDGIMLQLLIRGMIFGTQRD